MFGWVYWLHSDCENELLAEGCQQEDLWGASWQQVTHSIDFGSMINYRARQKNYAEIPQDAAVRSRMVEVIKDLLEGSI